jgi:hypothetical protein
MEKTGYGVYNSRAPKRDLRVREVEAGFAGELTVEVVTLLPPAGEGAVLPGWVRRFVEALRRRAPVKLVLVDVLSPRGLYMVLRYGGRLPLVVVNGRRVPVGEAEERPEELAEQVYRSTLEEPFGERV